MTVVPAEDRHAAELAEFIRAVWTPTATSESVLAARFEEARLNVAEPGVAPPTFIALQSGKVLGYVTTIPVRLWDGSADKPAYLIKGLMVHPDFRNGPIGYLVLKAAVASLPRTAALAVALPARRLFQALGYQDFGAVPNFVRPIAPERVLNRLDLSGLALDNLPSWSTSALRFARSTGLATLGGWVGGWFLRIASGTSRITGAGLTTGPIEPPSAAELDHLWRVVKSRFPAAVVRDGAYLHHRYVFPGESPYEWVGVRRRGALAGVALMRRPRADGDPRLRGIRLATLSDILFAADDAAAGLALLGAVEAAARRAGADAILSSGSAPVLQKLLKRQWYLPLSGNVHFLFRDVTGEGPAAPTTLPEWWLTRGDGFSDDVF